MKHGLFRFITITLLLAPSIAFANKPLHLKSNAMPSAQVTFSGVKQQSNLYVVQWKSVVTEAQKQEIVRQGGTILEYVPQDAFIVRLQSTEAVAAVTKLPFIEEVVPYHAGNKVAQDLAPLGIFSFDESTYISVQFAKGTSRDVIFAAFSSVPVALSSDTYVGESTVENAFALAKSDDVLWIEPFYPIESFELKYNELVADGNEPTTFASNTGFESGTRVMNMDLGYRRGFTGQNEIVGFADTGLDRGDKNDLHRDFQGQILSAYAVAPFGQTWADPHSHGTHVAGSIAGNGTESNGLVRGAGYGARLVVNGLWSSIANNIMIPGVDKLFGLAYRDGARIHSNSWGSPRSNGRYDTMARNVDQYAFEHLDFLPVFAAGNDGADDDRNGVIDEGTVSSPGTAKNVLTVGASQNYLLEGGIQRPMNELRNGSAKWGVEPIASSRLSANARGMAAFSSRGPTQDGRIKPDVVAPGTNIVATRSRHKDAGKGWGEFDDHYLYMGGTSMATPLTSGAAAVIRQYLKERTGSDYISAALLKATMISSAYDLFPGQFGFRNQGQEQPTRRPNNHQGFGLVRMDDLVNGSAKHYFVDNTTGLATGEKIEYTIESRGRPLRITLAYTDAAGGSMASKTLVNDLDVSVISADGKVYFPNRLSRADRTNNVEHIDIPAITGRFVVRVNAHNVPSGRNGKQPFALVAIN